MFVFQRFVFLAKNLDKTLIFLLTRQPGHSAGGRKKPGRRGSMGTPDTMICFTKFDAIRRDQGFFFNLKNLPV
jgi:hypothetical protein